MRAQFKKGVRWSESRNLEFHTDLRKNPQTDKTTHEKLEAHRGERRGGRFGIGRKGLVLVEARIIITVSRNMV